MPNKKWNKFSPLTTALMSVIICLSLGQSAINAEQNAEPSNKPDQMQTLLPQENEKPAAEEPAKKPVTLQDRLAEAALKRTANLVIYNPKYFKIPYPGGDVPAHFGVCTDVIIRSYREVGIDLQKDVHQKIGGDANIAHRRVKVLQKFFKRYGTTLPVTNDPKDYKPGDIVTYFLEQAISSQDHIAIVSDKIGTSGAPMIIHNIGLGPKLDDDLFSFKITGHYRYGK